MSLNSYNIANGSGAAVRAAINAAFQALVGNNSASTDPSLSVTTYAYQMWVDTSGASPVLKVRNGANTAWIVVGVLDTINLGHNPQQAGSSAPSTTIAYQLWFDTSVSPAILRMRNAANSAWIVFLPDTTAAYGGLVPITGGTFTGPILGSNTDYWRVPQGTTAQRPGSPGAGMLRYNTDLACMEAYVNGAWQTVGGSGGGGGSLRWNEGVNAPTPSLDSAANQIYSFQAVLAQSLFAQVKVPNGYTSGSQIKLRLAFYSPDSSGNVGLSTIATKITPGTDAFTSTANQRTSTNAAVTLSAPTVNKPQMVAFDLTDSSGKINSLSVAAGDLINIQLSRSAGDTATSDVAVMVYAAEITFQ